MEHYIFKLTFEGLSANDPKMEALPEVALLDYLLTSKYILDLRQTLALHRRVDDYAFYFGEFLYISNTNLRNIIQGTKFYSQDVDSMSFTIKRSKLKY